MNITTKFKSGDTLFFWSYCPNGVSKAKVVKTSITEEDGELFISYKCVIEGDSTGYGVIEDKAFETEAECLAANS